MQKLVFVAILLFFTSSAFGDKAQVMKVTESVKRFVMLKQPETKAIITAIQSIEPEHHRLSERRRERIAKAIISSSQKTGVDPVLLTAVIRVESDFQRIYRLWPNCTDPKSSRCWADCGISQHHLRGPKNWVIRRCKFYTKNIEASILVSAKEIARHIQFCQTRSKDRVFARCVLNRYNGGPFYKRRYRCSRRYWGCTSACPKDERLYNERAACLRRCARRVFKCKTIANYWRRVLCFEYGARNKARPVKNCRNVWDLEKVPTKFYRVDREAE